MHNLMYGIGQVKIVKFFIQPTGIYHDAFIRPYVPIAGNTAINKIIEKINNNQKLDVNNISDVATEIIAPSSTPELLAAIPNGWQTSRYKFYLVVESCDYSGHNKFIEHIIGYTNYPGISFQNSENPAIDPKMEFIINSILVYKVNDFVTNTGYVGSNIQSFNNFNLLTNRNAQKQLNALKPENVLNTIRLADQGIENNSFVEDYSRTINNYKSTDSSTLNNSPIHWVSNTIGSVHKAIIDKNTGRDDDPYDDDYYGQTIMTTGPVDHAISRYLSTKDTLSNSSFKNFLTDRMSQHLISDNVFLFEELVQFNKGPFNYNVLPVSNIGSLHNLDMSQDWSGSDILTQNAHLIALTFPELMLKYSLINVSMSFTNQTLDNNIIYNPHGVKSILADDPNEVSRFESFANEYLFMYMNKILDFNSCSATITITCNVLGDIKIEFFNYSGYIGNEPHRVYCCPNFANSTFSNVITSDLNNYNQVVNDVNTIISEIDSRVTMGFQTTYRQNNIFQNNNDSPINTSMSVTNVVPKF